MAKRTAGEKPVQLKNLFPDFNYGSKETTKADNFISPYIGKEYTNASEVLSIGLESLFEPRLYGQIKRRFLTNGKYTSEYAKITDDEEYLYLIIGLILKA